MHFAAMEFHIGMRDLARCGIVPAMAARKPSDKPTATAPPEAREDASFDAVLDQLKGIVETLERGDNSLEESLVLYERGVALTRRGHELLNTAEKRIELLVGAGGATAPLDPPPAEME